MYGPFVLFETCDWIVFFFAIQFATLSVSFFRFCRLRGDIIYTVSCLALSAFLCGVFISCWLLVLLRDSSLILAARCQSKDGDVDAGTHLSLVRMKSTHEVSYFFIKSFFFLTLVVLRANEGLFEHLSRF